MTDINTKIEWIAETDFTGSPRDHIREGLRGFPYRKRCIYYRSYSERIVIVRVLHGSQDVTQQDFEERRFMATLDEQQIAHLGMIQGVIDNEP